MSKSKPNLSLMMVGTVHRDPHGFAKLSQLLEREQPDLITVEVSPYARFFRSRESASMRTALRRNLQKIGREKGRPLHQIISHSAILGIFFLLKEPYEWRAAKAYADRQGITPWEVDLSLYSQEKLSHLGPLISEENLRFLLRNPSPSLSEQVKFLYSRARFFFFHPPSVWPRDQEIKERESYMAARIRRLVRGKKGKKIMHVGGWEHLIELPQGKSLFGLLEDFHPQRILLSSLAH